MCAGYSRGKPAGSPLRSLPVPSCCTEHPAWREPIGSKQPLEHFRAESACGHAWLRISSQSLGSVLMLLEGRCVGGAAVQESHWVLGCPQGCARCGVGAAQLASGGSSFFCGPLCVSTRGGWESLAGSGGEAGREEAESGIYSWLGYRQGERSQGPPHWRAQAGAEVPSTRGMELPPLSPAGVAQPWWAVPGLQELNHQHFSLLTSP